MLKDPRIVVPGEQLHSLAVYDMCTASWTWGHAHGLAEAGARRPRFNDGPPLPTRGPLPTEAIEWAQRRTTLAGKWSRDLDAKVTSILVQSLETGATNKDVMDALERVFPTFSKLRLENIARTESIAAYNQGRLAAFRADQDIVAVQFAAVLDSRTTKTCRARDGLIMRMDDERLPANTPPLHFMCRSSLVPVDKYDWEDLQARDANAEASFFGWVDAGGPKSLTQALSWDAAPAPLPGFGDVADLAGKPPAPKPATEAPVKPDAPKPKPLLVQAARATFAALPPVVKAEWVLAADADGEPSSEDSFANRLAEYLLDRGGFMKRFAALGAFFGRHLGA